MRPAVAARLLLGIVLVCGATQGEAQIPSQPLVIGDLSGSMRGFADASGNSIGSLYQILVMNIPAAQLWGLRTSSTPVPQNRNTFFAAARNYGGDTDLANAIGNIRENHQLAVLVTDGLQSEAKYLSIKDQLSKTVTAGWGLWLIEVDLPFRGIYDTEMAIDLQGLKPSIEACAQSRDKQARVTLKPKSDRIYEYAGSRPLLMFVFSKDTNAGRQLTEKLISNITADKRFAPRAVEIAPLIYRGVQFVEPVLGDPSDYMRVDNFSTGTAIIHSDTADAKRTKDLVLPIAWSADPPSLPQVFDEKANYDFEQCSWLHQDPRDEPTAADQDARITGNVRFTIISELSWFRSHFCWFPGFSCSEEKSGALNLVASTEFEPTPNQWWTELSTDTSWECPNKVFKLSELVKDVASEAVKHHQQQRKDNNVTFKLVVGPL